MCSSRIEIHQNGARFLAMVILLEVEMNHLERSEFESDLAANLRQVDTPHHERPRIALPNPSFGDVEFLCRQPDEYKTKETAGYQSVFSSKLDPLITKK